MGRPKKSKEAILARRRLAKRKKYAALKENEELYAIEKEKERQRYLQRKKENKIIGIDKLTPRAQRERRRKWKINSKRYLEKKAEKKKIENVQINTDDFQIEEQSNLDPLGSNTSSFMISSNNNTNIKENVKRDFSEEMFTLRAQIRKLRYQRFKEVRRLKCIINDLKKENKKFRRLLLKNTSRVNIRDQPKTKLIGEIRKKKQMEKKNKHVIKAIETFFDDDENTWLSPGKKEFVKRNKIKKQRRYLNDTLKNLYQKFIKDSPDINASYSFFCKCRPFWVSFPKENRNTCMCIYHCNVELLIKSLYKSNIVKTKNTHDLLMAICCDKYNEQCLDRKCLSCKNKTIEYLEFRNDVEIVYFEWCKTSGTYMKDGKENKKVTWTKKDICAKPLDVINKLDTALEHFLPHCANILIQNRSLKELKRNLSNNEAIIHLDFSENYCLKHHEEIQSFHFGGSRQQVSIHTVVIYIKDDLTSEVKVLSMCTLSDDLRHNAVSVWAHIDPVLKYISELSPFVDTLHFYSDSPSSQYRNRHIFFIASQLEQQFPALRKLTWNYLEAGHGKGAPDGLGAVIKRNADRLVKSGTDVGTFDKFVEITKANTSSIKIEIIRSSDITVKEQNYPKKVPGYKGTMEVHQILWAIETPRQLEIRSRSCFKCLDTMCVHYHHGYHKLGNVSVDTHAVSVLHREEEPSVMCLIDDECIRRFSPELIQKLPKTISAQPIETAIQIGTDNVFPYPPNVLCPVNRNLQTKNDTVQNASTSGKKRARKCTLEVLSCSQSQQESPTTTKKMKIQHIISNMTKQEGKLNTIILTKPKSVIPLSAVPKLGNWQNSPFFNNQTTSYSSEFQKFITDNQNTTKDEGKSQVIDCGTHTDDGNEEANVGVTNNMTNVTLTECVEVEYKRHGNIYFDEAEPGCSAEQNIKAKIKEEGNKATITRGCSAKKNIKVEVKDEGNKATMTRGCSAKKNIKVKVKDEGNKATMTRGKGKGRGKGKK